jgi:3-oxoacyl-[acyl-carrier-protein] synthase II
MARDLRRAHRIRASGDAHHITAPAEDGDGALRCMNAALKRAGISAAEIDYINAHGTSTPLGDEIELGAVHRLVGNAAGRMCMSSTKSSIGHLLGAAGAVEAIFSILAMRDGVVPPTSTSSIRRKVTPVSSRTTRRNATSTLSSPIPSGSAEPMPPSFFAVLWISG